MNLFYIMEALIKKFRQSPELAEKLERAKFFEEILMQVREDIRYHNKVTQAFQNAEKAFWGVSDDAGFYKESELQDYVKKIHQEEE